MINKIIKENNYRGFDYFVKHLDWTDNTKKGNIDNSYSLDYKRTTDWYCGYVRIPEGHEFYGKRYQDLPYFDVHGGLTFSGELNGIDGYLIGFDCHHLWDTSIINDENYTERHCIKLIDQLIDGVTEND